MPSTAHRRVTTEGKRAAHRNRPTGQTVHRASTRPSPPSIDRRKNRSLHRNARRRRDQPQRSAEGFCNTCVDVKFPGCEDLKDGVDLFEEWYSLKNFAEDLHVILVQEPKGMVGNLYQRASPCPRPGPGMFGKAASSRPLWATAKTFGRIRSSRNSLVGGISWATGKVDADITPNIEIGDAALRGSAADEMISRPASSRSPSAGQPLKQQII